MRADVARRGLDTKKVVGIRNFCDDSLSTYYCKLEKSILQFSSSFQNSGTKLLSNENYSYIINGFNIGAVKFQSLLNDRLFFNMK